MKQEQHTAGFQPSAMPSTPERPVFLVGCVRSGTTFAQTLVGSHPNVLTFPETSFVASVFGDYMKRVYCTRPTALKKLRTSARFLLGRSTGAATRHMAETLDALGEPAGRNPIAKGFPPINGTIRAWAGVLDDIASERGCTVWLEKTPMHVGYIDAIQKVRPDALFLHIFREPTAAIASIIDASRKYRGWEHYSTVRYCLDVWNRSIELATPYADKPNHFMFRYESLMARPEEILEKIFGFIGLEPVSFTEIAESRALTVSRVVKRDEDYKDNVGGPIINIDKSSSVLSDDNRDYIRHNALPIPKAAI